jgi:hypothetical protein
MRQKRITKRVSVTHGDVFGYNLDTGELENRQVTIPQRVTDPGLLLMLSVTENFMAIDALITDIEEFNYVMSEGDFLKKGKVIYFVATAR